MPSIQGDPSNQAQFVSYPSRQIPDDLIARRAYENWEKAGRPSGRDRQFWAEAETQLRTEQARREASARRFDLVESEAEREYPGRKATPSRPDPSDFPERPKFPGPVHIHRGAPADDDRLRAFLDGAHATVDSSWIRAAQYIAHERWLNVWFLNGYGVRVENVSPSEAASFYTSGSKGQWYWSNVLGPGYRLGSRSGSAKNWVAI